MHYFLMRRIGGSFFYDSEILRDKARLAEISSCAIPLEKAINNGRDHRDETRRQRNSVALTMRGTPSFVFL